ncbi:flavin reductase family protein [Streptomyces sp. GQFP]|uniref:flavin reductase family protein n=1 Tax=Streptomyces sp. GQFP TaxID=2907545 RepID=UPI001F27BC60|nr:flavin reductase family protein [Streptomyces sp. GQFP]UIX29186.1 flavin reductase family protein [Streptomyces sp. GQFP]
MTSSVERTDMLFDQAVLRRAFGCFPSGVTAVCGMLDGVPQGMAASSFTSVSLAPPLVSVCVAHTSTTWPTLAALPRIGVSVLAEGHTGEVSALASKKGDRFADVSWEAAESGAVFVHGSTLWLECEVHDQLPAGDHDVVLLRICSLQANPDVAPMVFHNSGFRRLLPVRPPQAA